MKGVAVVGASDRTLWSYWLIKNLQLYGYGGGIWPVNPRRRELFGITCYPGLDELPGTPEIGAIITPPGVAAGACEQLLKRGAHTVVVISNGFGETGTAAGQQAESELVQLCGAAGARLIGPNCVGYASLHDNLCAIAEPVPPTLQRGDVSLISHSGALISGALRALDLEGLGIDQCFSIGNGAAYDLTTALEAATERPATRVVCAIVETLPDRRRLESLIESRAADGKTFVLLALGQSEGGKLVAQSHTGAVLGEHRLARAWLNKIGVVVTSSIEQMARTALLARAIGRPEAGRGIFVVTGSGGGAGLAADLAQRHSAPLAEVSEQTMRQITAVLPDGAYAGNPLDLVAGMTPADRDAVLSAICTDPAVAAVVQPYQITWPDAGEGRRWHRNSLELFAKHASAAGVPGIVASVFEDTPTPWMDDYRERTGVLVARGLDITMSALGALYATGGAKYRYGRDPAGRPADSNRSVVIAEAQARAVLEEAGLAVAAGSYAADAQAAVAAAAALPAPWVVKLAVAGVGHKGRVGGVAVGLRDPAEVEAACRDIMAAACSAGVVANSSEAGFLVQEMLVGPELLVGAVRDRSAGPSLTVAVGGWAAEAVVPFGVLTLPASEAEVAAAATSWNFERLLGPRRTAEFVIYLASLGTEFCTGRLSKFTVVEINPLILSPTGPAAADVLILA